MKKFHALLLASGILLFAYLLWNVGPKELWRELGLLGWGLVPIILGEGLAEMIHTLGWRHCLSRPHRSLSWTTLFPIRIAGYAINYLTPTASLGGEVTKGALLASHHPGPEAASGVLIGKLCFALAHLVFVAFGALFVLWRVPMPKPFWAAMLASGGLVGLCMIIFLWLQNRGKLGALVRWAALRNPRSLSLQKAARHLTTLDDTIMRFHREHPGQLFLAIAWHLAGYSLGIVQTWLFFRFLHQDTSLWVAASAWFLGMWFDLLTFAIPLNLGTLEGTRILILETIGYTALMGMTYGFAFRLAQMFWACFGLVNYAFLASRIARPANGEPFALRQSSGAFD